MQAAHIVVGSHCLPMEDIEAAFADHIRRSLAELRCELRRRGVSPAAIESRLDDEADELAGWQWRVMMAMRAPTAH